MTKFRANSHVKSDKYNYSTVLRHMVFFFKVKIYMDTHGQNIWMIVVREKQTVFHYSDYILNY